MGGSQKFRIMTHEKSLKEKQILRNAVTCNKMWDPSPKNKNKKMLFSMYALHVT